MLIVESSLHTNALHALQWLRENPEQYLSVLADVCRRDSDASSDLRRRLLEVAGRGDAASRIDLLSHLLDPQLNPTWAVRLDNMQCVAREVTAALAVLKSWQSIFSLSDCGRFNLARALALIDDPRSAIVTYVECCHSGEDRCLRLEAALALARSGELASALNKLSSLTDLDHDWILPNLTDVFKDEIAVETVDALGNLGAPALPYLRALTYFRIARCVRRFFGVVRVAAHMARLGEPGNGLDVLRQAIESYAAVIYWSRVGWRRCGPGGEVESECVAGIWQSVTADTTRALEMMIPTALDSSVNLEPVIQAAIASQCWSAVWMVARRLPNQLVDHLSDALVAK